MKETLFTSRLKEQNAIRQDIHKLVEKFDKKELTYFTLCENTNMTALALSMKHLWAIRTKKLKKHEAAPTLD